MCDFSKGFILCTCEKTAPKIIHHKNSRKHKKNPLPEENIYHWSLSISTPRDEDFMMEGLCEMPSHQVGNGLEEEWVLLNLNCEKCFDFDYVPQEGDNLIIKYSKKPQFLSFIFKNNLWISKFYSPFTHLSTLKSKGKIKEKDFPQ